VQFVADGPDIPDDIFQDLEDEKLILFCGAGLSMASNLPSFRRLVELVIVRTGVVPVRSVNDEQQLDRILEVVEKKIGNRMREEVIKILSEKPKQSGIASQRAALDLARLNDGRVRCVTTNFDNLFTRGARGAPRISLTIDAAPTVPVPKPDRWASLVYLHGRIDSGGA
jgi:NAD-dependent SIR2 family protein deacetylase